MISRIGGISRAVCLALLFAAQARAGDTWVVDDDGPANFHDLATAVAAARDGDVLLIRPGHYRAAQVVRKGLSLLGAGPSLVTVEAEPGTPALAARELGTSQQLVVSGLTVAGRGETITVERCGGPVVLADLVIEGRDEKRASRGPQFTDCLNLILARVAILPGAGVPGSAPALDLIRCNAALTQVVGVAPDGAAAKSPRGRGAPGCVGLAITDSAAELAQCEFVGGDGGAALWDAAAPFCPEAAVGGAGGTALATSGLSSILVFNPTNGELRGGRGGAAARNPWERCWSFAGDGGTGLSASATEKGLPNVRLSNVTLVAGPAGVGDASRAGKEGRDRDAGIESLTWESAVVPTIAIDHHAIGGREVTFRAHGAPGDVVTVLVSNVIGLARLRGARGFALRALPGEFWLVMTLGRLDDKGDLVTDSTLPAEAGYVGRTFLVQAVMTGSGGGQGSARLSNVDVLAITDGFGPPVVRSE